MFAVPVPIAVMVVDVAAAVPVVITAVLELLHVPPEVAALKVVLPPTQSANVPVIAAGGLPMVTTAVALQPPGII
jgi:hypothetical protein